MATSEALYSVRPSYAEKFRPAPVKTLISAVLADKLSDKSCVAPTFLPCATLNRGSMHWHADVSRRARTRYNPELTAQWTREIADEIKNKLKTELELPRYKFVVQVVVGEQRGEGVRMGCRCFWDADTDNYAEESYRNVRRPSARLCQALARNGSPVSPTPLLTLLACCALSVRRTRSFALRPYSAPTCTERVGGWGFCAHGMLSTAILWLCATCSSEGARQ